MLNPQESKAAGCHADITYFKKTHKLNNKLNQEQERGMHKWTQHSRKIILAPCY